MQYETEEQQVEALKSWWKKHGQSIVYGVVGGLLIAGGWNYWQTQNAAKSETASIVYENVLAAQMQGDNGLAARQARDLMTQYAGTPYAISGALVLAKIRAEAGEFDQAEDALRWAMAETQSSELRWLAQMRLVNVLIAKNQLAEAQTQLDALAKQSASTTAKAGVADLQGDLALMQGNPQAAKAAYDLALSLMPAEETLTNLVRMKRDNLN
jgi:predicted negative regulator of RcsB-dependent stress response